MSSLYCALSSLQWSRSRISGSSLAPDEIIAYRLAQDAQGETSPASPIQDSTTETETDDSTRVLSFAELKELIESGRVDKIPNNKHIPNKLNVSLWRIALASSDSSFCRKRCQASQRLPSARNLGNQRIQKRHRSMSPKLEATSRADWALNRMSLLSLSPVCRSKLLFCFREIRWNLPCYD